MDFVVCKRNSLFLRGLTAHTAFGFRWNCFGIKGRKQGLPLKLKQGSGPDKRCFPIQISRCHHGYGYLWLPQLAFFEMERKPGSVFCCKNVEFVTLTLMMPRSWWQCTSHVGKSRGWTGMRTRSFFQINSQPRNSERNACCQDPTLSASARTGRACFSLQAGERLTGDQLRVATCLLPICRPLRQTMLFSTEATMCGYHLGRPIDRRSFFYFFSESWNFIYNLPIYNLNNEHYKGGLRNRRRSCRSHKCHVLVNVCSYISKIMFQYVKNMFMGRKEKKH
jgi:hypothetical protein